MFENLYVELGVDGVYVAMVTPAIIIILNFLKDVVGISGKKQIMIAAGVLAVGFGLKAMPDPVAFFFTSVACWISPIGTWYGVKRIAHKVGTLGTTKGGK